MVGWGLGEARQRWLINRQAVGAAVYIRDLLPFRRQHCSPLALRPVAPNPLIFSHFLKLDSENRGAEFK